MNTIALPAEIARRNRRVGLYAVLVALAMLGLGYASSPLYRMFCQATGFAGTTRRATVAEASAVSVTDKLVKIRFDANIERGMAWQFRPERGADTIQMGGRHMAIFLARNLSDKPLTGRASFNVEPEQAGRYFNKIQCFCFTEQTLQPGQEVRMPVIYFVDPKMLNDPDASDIEEITLSYTFHPIAPKSIGNDGAKALDRAREAG
jgi:cytochrome c oxidase assembly protein subunit 11